MATVASARLIREFNAWQLVAFDTTGEKRYVHKESGVVVEDPPDEVLEQLIIENSQRRAQVYEKTKHRLVFSEVAELLEQDIDSDFEEEGVPLHIDRELLLDGSGCALVLRNLMSRAECQRMVAKGEELGLQDCGYSKRVRVTDRVSVMGEDLAARLFQRVCAHLGTIVVPQPLGPLRRRAGSSSHAEGLRGIRREAKPGVWTPSGLNPCFRFCRYSPGGFFLPHFDHGFEYSDTHLSLKTFMLYLNEDFEGGLTTFYQDSQEHYDEPDHSKVEHLFKPECGSCLIFNHSIVHGGGSVSSGLKYILRTEVMYRWMGLAPTVEA